MHIAQIAPLTEAVPPEVVWRHRARGRESVRRAGAARSRSHAVRCSGCANRRQVDPGARLLDPARSRAAQVRRRRTPLDAARGATTRLAVRHPAFPHRPAALSRFRASGASDRDDAAWTPGPDGPRIGVRALAAIRPRVDLRSSAHPAAVRQLARDGSARPADAAFRVPRAAAAGLSRVPRADLAGEAPGRRDLDRAPRRHPAEDRREGRQRSTATTSKRASRRSSTIR